MMKGKISQDDGRYVLKMGGVTIDITIDVCDLIAQTIAQERVRSDEVIARERARLATVVDRYNQITRIVLADHNPGPIACQGAPTG